MTDLTLAEAAIAAKALGKRGQWENGVSIRKRGQSPIFINALM